MSVAPETARVLPPNFGSPSSASPARVIRLKLSSNRAPIEAYISTVPRGKTTLGEGCQYSLDLSCDRRLSEAIARVAPAYSPLDHGPQLLHQLAAHAERVLDRDGVEAAARRDAVLKHHSPNGYDDAPGTLVTLIRARDAWHLVRIDRLIVPRRDPGYFALITREEIREAADSLAGYLHVWKHEPERFLPDEDSIVAAGGCRVYSSRGGYAVRPATYLRLRQRELDGLHVGSVADLFSSDRALIEQAQLPVPAGATPSPGTTSAEPPETQPLTARSG